MTPAQEICARNGWRKGTILEGRYKPYPRETITIEITAIGESVLLGRMLRIGKDEAAPYHRDERVFTLGEWEWTEKPLTNLFALQEQKP